MAPFNYVFSLKSDDCVVGTTTKPVVKGSSKSLCRQTATIDVPVIRDGPHLLDILVQA